MPTSNRKFGLTIFCALIALCALIFFKHHLVNVWLLAIAMVWLLVTLAQPKWLSPFNWLWTKLGLVLHSITTPILMTIIYYLVFLPMGLMMRLLGKRPLLAKPAANSYWIMREPPGPEPESLQEQF